MDNPRTEIPSITSGSPEKQTNGQGSPFSQAFVGDFESREAELRDFIEHAAVALHWVAEDGTILWANEAELMLLGYSREEYIGHNILEFHADEAVILEILRRLKNNEQIKGCEARLRCKDASIRYVSINSSVYREEGRFVHTRCVTLDIGEQKKTAEIRNRLAAIVESSDDAILSKDLNGIILSWNRGAERIFGYTGEEIIGKHISTLAAPGRADEIPDILQRLARGERVDHYETKRKREGWGNSDSFIDRFAYPRCIRDDHRRVKSGP